MDKDDKSNKSADFKTLLRKERERRGWSQKDLADHLDLPDTRTVGRWERGETTPRPYHRRDLSRVLGKSIEELGLLKQTSDPGGLEEDILVKEPESPTKEPEFLPFWNVPVSFHKCLGRSQEIAAVCSLLKQPDVRLLTILGPGGIGKTRLALEIAEQMRTYFGDGVCYVSLVALNDPALVLPLIAQELNVHENEKLPLRGLLQSFLVQKQFLLIADNFEQVREAALVVEQLLAQCPNLKVLVTSQVPLHLLAEREFPLEPLACPRDRLPAESGTLAQYPAVALFLQHAQAFLPAFQITPQNAQNIAEICTHLDGLPLAIELAAARIKLLPVQALLKQIKQQRFKILRSERHFQDVRHLTLYNTLKWSYKLLDAGEQWLFRHLSVFTGGCTLEAAEALCQAYEEQSIDAFTTINSLIDRSLIQRSNQEDAPYFTLLETVREFGADCLRMQGEWEASQQAHAEYYLALTKQAEPHLKAAGQGEWLEHLEREKENLRAALTWFLDKRETEKALQFFEAFGKFCGLQGYWSEEQHWLEVVLEQAEDLQPTRALARALRRAGLLMYRFRELEKARVWLEKSMALSREMGDQSNLAGALSGLGWVLYRQQKIAATGPLLRESVEVARRSGDKWALANTLESLGRFAHLQGSSDEAYRLVRESVALARKVADKETLARSLYTLVTIEIAQGKMEQAEHSAWESYTLARDAGKKPLIALTLDGLANIAFSQEEYENAVELYERRIQLAQELNDYSTIASKRLRLGEIALKQKNVEIAENLVQESLAFFRAQADKPNIALALYLLGDTKRIKKDFDRAISFYREALVLEQYMGIKENIGRCLIGLSQNFLERGMPEQAAKLLGFASTYLGPPEKVTSPSLASEYRLTLERTRVLLGQQTFDTFWSSSSHIRDDDILRVFDR